MLLLQLELAFIQQVDLEAFLEYHNYPRVVDELYAKYLLLELNLIYPVIIIVIHYHAFILTVNVNILVVVEQYKPIEHLCSVIDFNYFMADVLVISAV
jgi:hypothetical protein